MKPIPPTKPITTIQVIITADGIQLHRECESAELWNTDYSLNWWGGFAPWVETTGKREQHEAL